VLQVADAAAAAAAAAAVPVGGGAVKTELSRPGHLQHATTTERAMAQGPTAQPIEFCPALKGRWETGAATPGVCL